MTLYLVRHAKSIRRADWEDGESYRSLTAGGHRQARRLAAVLADAPVTRILSSPHLRCRQTVEPLAAQRGRFLEIDERLAEGAPVDAALDLVRELAGETAVLCSHGELIIGLLRGLRGGSPSADAEIRCEKGSVWVLEDGGRATYVPAPSRTSDFPPGKEARAELEFGDPGGFEDAAPGDKLRVSVLDLGSTSFHLLVADTTPYGTIRRVLRERSMLRLGAMIASESGVPEETCERAIAAARELCEHSRRAGSERLLPVATAALREVRNGAELAARIGLAIGAPVRILGGEEEARLIFAAFRHRVALPPGNALGLDLGGGSLELAAGDDDDVHWETTLPLGVARLHGELVRSDPMSRKQAAALRSRVRDLLAPHAATVARYAPSAAIATGGTIGALARRIVTRRTSWPSRAVSQLFIPRAELVDLADELVSSSHEERLRTVGISRQRADLLPTGALVFETAVRELGLDGVTVSDWGLREGVILEELGLARSGRRLAPAST